MLYTLFYVSKVELSIRYSAHTFQVLTIYFFEISLPLFQSAILLVFINFCLDAVYSSCRMCMMLSGVGNFFQQTLEMEIIRNYQESEEGV